MTKRLERAVAEASALAEAEQDALAARILAQIDDEREWDRAFAATTDEEWDELAATVRRDAGVEGSSPPDEVVRGRRG